MTCLIKGRTIDTIASLSGYLFSRTTIKKIAIRATLFLSLFSLLTFYLPVEARGSLRRSAVVIAVEKVSPAVVNISTIIKERVRAYSFFSGQEFFKDFFPDLFSREYQRTSLGSGVIIDGVKGYIVTNHHVVYGAAEINVITSDQKEYKARIKGSDYRSDLAVLLIEPEIKLPQISLGNSEGIMIGETVIAIGNPFGLSKTVTTGVVSAVNRSVRSGKNVYRNFIQTDASINPGNSGGPLLNIDGDLIGINTAIYQKAQGIGFAIPINKVKIIVEELIHAGEVRFPWLGLEIQELTDGLKSYFGISPETQGILVSDVYQDGPADKADLKRGDILTALQEVPIFSKSAYLDALSEFTPGVTLQLKLFRQGKEINTVVKPSSFPVDLALDMVDRRLGMRVKEIDEVAKGKYGLEGGVLIRQVTRDSNAGEVGIQPGDLILKINDTLIKNLDDFKKAIGRYHYYQALTLLVRRGPYGYSITLPF